MASHVLSLGRQESDNFAVFLKGCAAMAEPAARTSLEQVIRPIGAEVLNRRPPAGPCRLFLGPGFRLGARWNRLVETVKTRKKREKTEQKWARYGLKGVKEGS